MGLRAQQPALLVPIVVLLLAACNSPTSPSPFAVGLRQLASDYALDALAVAGPFDGLFVTCNLEFSLRLAELSGRRANERGYDVLWGGTITRFASEAPSPGLRFLADHGGEALLVVTAPDSVRLRFGSTIEIVRNDILEGKLRSDGSFAGTWECVPRPGEIPGIRDLPVSITGSWTARPAG